MTVTLIQNESVSIYRKSCIPILLTVSNNIRQKNVIKRVKLLIIYDIIIETLEH